MGKTLDGFPTWCQLRDPLPSGVSDPFAAQDCGEESCSIVEYAFTGKYTTEEQVRHEMPGHESSAPTTGFDLVQYLRKVGVGSEVTQITAANLQAEVKLGVRLGRCAILLGNWVSASALHWVVAIGYGNDHMLYVDPWYGEMRAMHWADARARFHEQVVRAWPKAPKNAA